MGAVTAPMTTSQFANAIDRGIRKHFVDEYKAKKPKLEKVAQISDQADYNEEEMTYTGAGDMQIITEGSRYPTGTLLEQFKTTYTPVKYGDTVSVTYEQQKWDKSGLSDAKNIGSAQAKQVTRKMEKVMANVYNKAFSTSYTSYGDAKPLASVDHTRADGGTSGSNASATSIPLSHDNLDSGVQSMRAFRDDRGELIECAPRILLVPPALEQTALVITKSANRSNTANNDTNVFKMQSYTGGKLEVVVWDYLSAASGGSDTAWFLLDPENFKVTWKWAEKPKIGEMDDTTGKLNDTFYWKVMFYASTGWSDWRGVWGSQGTGAAYAS